MAKKEKTKKEKLDKIQSETGLRDFDSNPLTKDEAYALQDAFDRLIYSLVAQGFDLRDLPDQAIENLYVMNQFFTDEK